MEISSVLTLISILSIIFLLTYFLSYRQKRALRKIVVKEEPRFDLIENSPKLLLRLEQDEPEEICDEKRSINLLMHDPILAPKPTVKNQLQPEAIKKPRYTNEEIIYLILAAASDKPYVGYELLQALLVVGLRFGAMNLFHRYEDNKVNTKILFSLASASEQGTFELHKIGAFSGKGLILFLKLSGQKDLLNAFNLMLETGKQLVEDLGGEILDDERNLLTQEKTIILKNKILEFEQKQLMGDLFGE
jgi:cell division protein ZipA